MTNTPVNDSNSPLSRAKEILRSTRDQRTRGARGPIGSEHNLAAGAVRGAVGAIDFRLLPDSMTAVAKMAFATAVIVDRAVRNTQNEMMRDVGGNLSASMAEFAQTLSPEGSRLRQAIQRRFPLS